MHDDHHDHHVCPGPSRRAVLGGGLATLLGLAYPRLGFATGAAPAGRKPRACILLWMNGGPSHIDTFDPKPGAKTGGPFKAIPTAVKGLQVSEHLPRVAEQADKLAVVRSMVSTEGNHDRGQYLMHTGYSPSATLQHPSFGSWVSHELGDAASALPNFVSISGPSVGAGFLSAEHQPFTVLDPREGVRNLPYAKDVDAARFDRRLAAFKIVESSFASATGTPESVGRHDLSHDKAVRLMRTPLAQSFEIAREPASVQKAYGENDFGRGCLMARRLVESGVRFVEVTLDGWDTHYDNFTAVKNLLAMVDPALSALLKDLSDRDMLDDTLVLWMGEFGRTPKISAADGRDHHPAAWSAVMAGGGVRGGIVHGATDEAGEKVAVDPVRVPDFFATAAVALGMDPRKQLMSPVGRPIGVTDSGKPVRSLLKA